MGQIYVCPLSGLAKTLQDSGARQMISFSAPGKAATRPAQIDREFLSLEFNDISEPQGELVPPDHSHIDQLLNFFEQRDRHSPVIIHCWMGISRSTAAALLASAFYDPAQDIDRLTALLRRLSPMATPNPLMIGLGHERLRLNGRLVDAVRRIGRGCEASEGIPFVMDVAP